MIYNFCGCEQQLIILWCKMKFIIKRLECEWGVQSCAFLFEKAQIKHSLEEEDFEDFVSAFQLG